MIFKVGKSYLDDSYKKSYKEMQNSKGRVIVWRAADRAGFSTDYTLFYKKHIYEKQRAIFPEPVRKI